MTPVPARTPSLLGGLLGNLGPLIVFYAFYWTMGLKPAIIACATFSIAEVMWRWWRKEPLTFLFKLTATTTIGLGLIDIALASPRFFSWQASITNAAFGAWFAWLMVKGADPFTEQLLAIQPNILDTWGPGGRGQLNGMMRVLLAIVVTYHVLLGVAYGWIAVRYTVEDAVGIRLIFGNVSLIPFLAAVYFFLHPLHRIAHMLMASLLYGSGLRLMECCCLRVKDIDFDRNSAPAGWICRTPLGASSRPRGAPGRGSGSSQPRALGSMWRRASAVATTSTRPCSRTPSTTRS